ncbi:MAG TPA: hypothetical protein VH136_13420 [Trebonia sp.]|nr:hypothetical protein [Trebonia sp.]
MLDEPGDPFATAELRGRVLDAWAASPARFREDANAEEDYALGGYRDRVVVELAQNAADAAARAGVPGRLRLTLRDGTLTAANTGAPLDAAGVEALSTLRASSKRGPDATGETVGRFGVGFAAVVAVSDAPRIRSLTGTVGWSRERTRELARGVPALAGELAERAGHVPVLRLPFADGRGAGGQVASNALPDGFATVVELPLRDEGAGQLADRLLAETGPALLLALPTLAEVVIETATGTRVLTAEHSGDATTITADGAVSRWRVTAAGGELDPALLADRPAEERTRTSWSVRWAVPLAGPDIGSGLTADAAVRDQPLGRLPAGVSAVVHAPTPTDEPLGLPALLLASFPLSPDRRHVAPGALTDFLIERAAEVYAGLLPGLAPGPGLLDLVPGPVGRGELDARLGRAITVRLPDVAFLPAVSGSRIRPRDALLLGSGLPGLAEWLAPVLPDLIAGPSRHPAYAVLGVRRLPLAELADMLAALDRTPTWWRGLYEALAAAAPDELAELGALPVPLADGRQVRGPRGLLLPGAGLEQPGRLAALGLRVVHPEAAHPLLARLGAVEATPRGVLADPATRAAVANSYDAAAEAGYDDDGPEQVADAVLGLLSAASAERGEYPWLTDLALRDADGEWVPAGELLLPDGPLAEVAAADAPFGVIDPEMVERYGAATLEAAGVLSSFDLLTAHDVDLTDPDLDLDEAGEWAEHVLALLPRVTAGAAAVPPIAVEVAAVRDLEFVDQDRWARALDLLARPPLRAALVEPVRVRLADGRHADVPSYTAWWLRRHVTLAGRRPAGLRAADSDPLLAGLYDDLAAAPSGVLADPAIARAFGVRTSLADLLTEPGGPDELLTRLADAARPVSRPQLRALWSALATAGLAPDEITPPEQVRAVRGTEVAVADAEEVLVLDAPDLWPLCAKQALVLAPHDQAATLADLLDLPLASEEIPGAVESSGRRTPVPPAVHAVLPAAPPAYQAHERLVVDGEEIPWRYRDGQVHAATPEGLACGLAWAAGRWSLRHVLAGLLSAPESAGRLLADADLD